MGTMKHSAASPRVGSGPHQEGLDVGLRASPARVGRHHLLPRVEGELRLGGAGRARVEGRHPLQGRVEEEEGHARRESAGSPTAPATAGSPGNARYRSGTAR